MACVRMFGNALDIKGALMEASTVEDDLLKLKRDLLSIDEQAARYRQFKVSGRDPKGSMACRC